MILNEDSSAEKREYRKFGLLVGGIALLLGLWPLVHQLSPRLWLVIVALLLLAFAAAFPKALWPVYKIWMKIGDCLGWINTRVILGVVFFLVLLPTGLIMRLLGKDPVLKKPVPGKASYWVASGHDNGGHRSMKHQF